MVLSRGGGPTSPIPNAVCCLSCREGGRRRELVARVCNGNGATLDQGDAPMTSNNVGGPETVEAAEPQESVSVASPRPGRRHRRRGHFLLRLRLHPGRPAGRPDRDRGQPARPGRAPQDRQARPDRRLRRSPRRRLRTGDLRTEGRDGHRRDTRPADCRPLRRQKSAPRRSTRSHSCWSPHPVPSAPSAGPCPRTNAPRLSPAFGPPQTPSTRRC